MLVVDDQAPFRRAARFVLDRAGAPFRWVGEAADAASAVALAGTLQPALVLLDIKLGDGPSGIDATRSILASSPSTVVFLCSTYGPDDLPEAAMSSGAAAYVHKSDFGPEVLRRLWAEHAPVA